MSGLVILRSSFLACLLLLASVELLGAEDTTRDCRNSGIVVNLWKKDGLTVSDDDVYKDFRAIAGTTCQLEETCCSHKLEQALQDTTAEEYTNKIRDAVTSHLSTCKQSSVIADTASFLLSFKVQVIKDLKNVYRTYFDGHEGILDDLFNAFVIAIQTGETGTINTLYQKTFFDLYLATYLTYPGNGDFPNTKGARDCFYEYYLKTEGTQVEKWRATFMPSFNSLMYFMRGLHAAELLVDKLTKHSVSEQCKASLVKMDRCSACAGYTSLRSCKGLCLNLLRGCLVDLSDLEEPLTTLSQALVEMNEHLAEADLPGRLVGLEQTLFELIGNTAAAAPSIKDDIGSCLSLRKKRSVRSDGEVRVKRQSHLVPRSQLEFPSEIYNETAQCLRERISGLMSLPESLCGASASRDNKNCWNGHLHDSYSREVVTFKRASQKYNPEVLYCPYPSQFQYEVNVIKYVTRELASVSGKCSSDDEDCGNFASLTNYYKFPAASTFKSVVISVDDEQDVEDGSGSGSGAGPVFVCESHVTSEEGNAPVTDSGSNVDVVVQQEESGAVSHQWSALISLLPLALTIIFAAPSWL